MPGENRTALGELLKNPLALLVIGALTGGTGIRMSVDDGDRFRGSDAKDMKTEILAELERRVAPHDAHLIQAEAWKDRILKVENNCLHAQRELDSHAADGH